MLLDTLQQDALAARKNQNAIAATLLTTLYAEAARFGKDKGNRVSTDDEVLAVITKFVKGVDETLAVLPATDSRVEQLKAEKVILSAYLPQQLTEAELAALIADIVATLAEKTPKQMGAVMGQLKAKAGGRYDSTTASRLVKTALGA